MVTDSQLTDLSRLPPAWSSSHETQLSMRAKSPILLTYPAYPFSTELYTLVSQLPIGFRCIALKQAVSIELLTIISRMSEIQAILAKTASHSAATPELDYLHRYQPESEFQEGFDCLRRLPPNPVTLDHCLCLAVMVFTNLTFNVMLFGSLWQRMRESLTNAILEYTPGPFEEHCISWTMMIAVWSWEGRLGLDAPGRTVLECMLTRHVTMRSSDAMIKIFRDFFFTEELDKILRKYWRGLDVAEIEDTRESQSS
jgi:hypothetical protein